MCLTGLSIPHYLRLRHHDIGLVFSSPDRVEPLLGVLSPHFCVVLTICAFGSVVFPFVQGGYRVPDGFIDPVLPEMMCCDSGSAPVVFLRGSFSSNSCRFFRHLFIELAFHRVVRVEPLLRQLPCLSLFLLPLTISCPRGLVVRTLTRTDGGVGSTGSDPPEGVFYTSALSVFPIR